MWYDVRVRPNFGRCYSVHSAQLNLGLNFFEANENMRKLKTKGTQSDVNAHVCMYMCI